MLDAFRNWLAVRRRNTRLLHRLADTIRDEYAALPYAIAADAKRPLVREREIDGVRLCWSEEISARRGGGEIRIDLEFSSPLPTLFGAKPARSFWMRPDGSIVPA